MALEGLSLSRTPPVDADAETPGGGRQVAVNGGDDGAKTPRLPRWTRQEILVLIQGKRVAESRVKRGRTAGLELGSAQVEPKWAAVSSYCMKQGVNRGPVQCRKRWSNLAGDFKKIREWEAQTKDESDSFWVMRNDLRRERKLPGFFDREVYDILDGGDSEDLTARLALALGPSVEAGAEDPEAETLFDSGRRAAAEDGLFSDFEPSGQDEAGFASPAKDLLPEKELKPSAIPDPIPISVYECCAEQQYVPFPQHTPVKGPIHQSNTTTTEPEVGSGPEGRKRKRNVTDAEEEEEEGAENLQQQLLKALERNGQLLSSQLEAQNAHMQLDREQRKDHVNSLISVLNKLSDALGKIADKL